MSFLTSTQSGRRGRHRNAMRVSALGREGSAILIVMVFAIMLSFAVGNLLRWAVTEQRLNTRNTVRVHGLYTAESVVEHGFAQLQNRFQNQTSFPPDSLDPDGATPLTVPDMLFFETGDISVLDLEILGGVIPPGEWTFIDPTDPANAMDPLAGMNVLAREVEVIGRAEVAGRGARIEAHAVQRLQVRDAPLFANAIFYNLDLEIAPGAAMQVHGTTHGNRGFYFQSGASLDFYDRVTTSGNFFHGRRPGSGQSVSNGAVGAIDGSGVLQSFNQGGQWLQSSTQDWRVRATEIWRGNVQSQAHGVQPHRPVAIEDYEPGVRNPAIELIQPPSHGGGPHVNPEIEAQKFSVKAGLRIRVNPAGGMNPGQGQGQGPGANPIRAWTQNGTEVDIPEGLFTTGPGHQMYDARRGKNLHMTDIDVGKLKQLIENPDYGDPNGHIGGFNPEDWNGVVYVESQNTANTGIRLVNGSQIPDYTAHGADSGFTFATNNALYVQGHYNADGNPNTGDARQPDGVGEPPAALIGDAVTILSGNWDDSKSWNSLNNRNTSSFTEVSAAIMTGIVPSGGGNYSGGVENLPRLLEPWSGNTLRIRGSMVVLYESEIATEPWEYGGMIYTAPNRDWGFHTLFQNGVYPPGTPNTRSYRRMHFRDISETEYDERVADILSQY